MLTILLAFAFLALGRADSISEVLSAPKAADIAPVVVCVAALAWILRPPTMHARGYSYMEVDRCRLTLPKWVRGTYAPC